MRYTKGEKVMIKEHWAKNLIGMNCVVVGFRTIPETEQEVELGKVLQNYIVQATDTGPYIKSRESGKTKKVFAWVPGNILSVADSQLTAL